MKLLAAALFVSSLAVPSSALAQKKIPKAQGHNQCPLGYVNTLGTTCVSPIYYEVKPTNGEACPSGWMNVGAGYCRKKFEILGLVSRFKDILDCLLKVSF